jgi:ferritin-like metal-binding protein YciE
MKKQGKIGRLAFQLKYRTQYIFFNNLYKFMNMATKNNGSAEPVEKISDSIFRSKTNANKNDYKKSGRASLKKIFEELLQDTYDAEQQLINALPEIGKVVDNEDLEVAIEDHLWETKDQATRLEKIFTRLRIEKKGKTCKAMEGLIEEIREISKNHDFGSSRDSAVIIGLQKIEHYEIAAYGSLVELADVLGLDNIADVLEEILEEEKNADELLSEIAQDVNDDAYEGIPSEYEVYA